MLQTNPTASADNALTRLKLQVSFSKQATYWLFVPESIGRQIMITRFALRTLILLLLLSLIGCVGPAAKKASKQKGATAADIGKCETRACFVGLLDYGGKILVSDKQPDGSLEEIYQVQRRKGSTLRSFTHGILSVATLGIWNVVGYPIEGFVSSADYIVYRVVYDAQGQPVKVEIQGG